MYLARVLTNHSLSEIGEFFGGRNHATVTFSFRRVEERRTSDAEFQGRLDRLLERLRG